LLVGKPPAAIGAPAAILKNPAILSKNRTITSRVGSHKRHKKHKASRFVPSVANLTAALLTATLQTTPVCGMIHVMVTVREINAFCRQMAEEYQPVRIVLFGSHAGGRPRPDSEVDMLVVMRFQGSEVSKSAEMIRKLSPPFAVDLVVRTPADVDRRLAMNDFFLKEVTNRGRILYESLDK